MQPQPRIPVAYRAPFAFGGEPWFDMRLPGESVLDIVRSVPRLPGQFFVRGVVCINGEVVPRELWSCVRPKPGTDALPVAVTLHWPLAGGGGSNSNKQIFGLVAALALIVVTAGIATLGVPLLGIAAGSFAATALAGAVGVAGSLAISALTKPPTQDAAADAGPGAANLDPAAASGNIISPGGAIPRVVGTRKVYPPFITEPVVELVDKDEVVEAVVALNGPHLLSDIRLDGVAIASAQDVTFETREGWPSDTPISLVTRQGKTSTPNITLSTHSTTSDNIHLLHPSLPETDLPIWHGVSARNSPDQIWIHFLFPGGLAQNGSTRLSVPIRIRMRLRGSSTWINLPEVHFAGDTIQETRCAIVFKWQEVSDPLETVPNDNGFNYANLSPPAQDPSAPPVTPANRLWVADSYFDDGVGNIYLYNGVESASRVRNVNLFKNRLEVYLKLATFPRGIYEFEIIRACSIITSTFSRTNYVYGATIFDFFWWQSPSAPQMLVSRAGSSDRCAITRVISIWNSPPVARDGFALIALKAINRSIQRISADASGYVRDWDGSGWNTWTTTSNPAPHYVDVLSGNQNLDPLPSDLRDDVGLVAWRTLCANNEWTCDAIIDDMRTQDVLGLLASCAYAKPYQSDIYGVTVDNDRSADVPVQVFSRINAANVKFERAFVRAPEGFVVTYRDNASDDDQAQTVVFQRDTSIATSGLLESIAYDGLIDVSKVRARALFDLDQANLRATFYSLDTDIEAIVCRRGSLVALQHDVLTSRMGDAHVRSKTLSGGSPASITGFVLDATIPVTNELDMHAVTNMHAVADMHKVGITTGIAIRRTDGTISTHALSNATGETDTITLAAPIADTSTIIGYDDSSDEYGCLVVAGDLSSEYRRMLVAQITASADLKASLTLVDEAPNLIRFGSNALFGMGDAAPLYSMGETDELVSMG